ncbi:MAG: hypothetical protein ABIJ08_03390 [Nanoarchaeota archaeon]
MKGYIFLAMLLVFVSFAHAQEGKVMVVNFQYKEGFITFKERTVMLGYYPDRNYQPENGYKAEIISATGEVLYSFKFNIGTDIFVDYDDNSALSGGLIRLNETDFSLVLPYLDEAYEIRFYNERNFKVASIDISEERFSPKGFFFPLWIVLILIIVVLIYMIKNRVSRH